MTNQPLRSLDERQLHLRRSLFREPYATGASLGLAGGLPSMVLAWRMPVDLTDDE